MKKEISKKTEQIDRMCSGCGERIRQHEIWYPTTDISTCGGGIAYLHAKCMVDRIFSETKEELLARVAEAGKEADDLLSDGIMNFYAVFPISPIHWVKYAVDDDEKEIAKIMKENKRADQKRTRKPTKE
jgi:hypothetical protein